MPKDRSRVKASPDPWQRTNLLVNTIRLAVAVAEWIHRSGPWL